MLNLYCGLRRLLPGRIFSAVAVFCLFAAANTSFAQSQDLASDTFRIKITSFILPQPTQYKKYTHSMGVQYVIVPKDWSLDNIQAPMFNYNGKYALPKGFNIQGTLSTIVVSNRISLGPFWNYSFSENLHAGVGYQIVFNYGRLSEFGFNTTLTGWEHQPSVTFGYSFNKSVITVRGDLYVTTALYLSEGGNTIPFTGTLVNGYSITTTVEQRLWKNRLLSFGVKLATLRYHILAWPAFPVNSYRYLVPEFQIGLKLGKK